MAYNVPPTKSVGNTLTAADWNTYVRDNMVDLAARLLPIAQTQILSEPSEFTTLSTSLVDITGAGVDLVTTRQSTIMLLASGWIRADYTGAEAAIVGSIGATVDTNSVRRSCQNASYDASYVPFSYVFFVTGVAAGTVHCKLQLKSSNASATAHCGSINLIAIGIPEV